MLNIKFDIKTILILVMGGVILFMNFCGNGNNNGDDNGDTIIKTDTITIIDTVHQQTTNYIPKPYKVIEINTVEIPVDVDTLAILRDYYAERIYDDTVKFDSLMVRIKDTVSENRLKSRSVESWTLYKTTVIENTIAKNRREFYYGIGITGNQNQIDYLGGEFLYRTKNNRIYGIGVGVNPQLEPVLSGRIYWKLQFRK